MRGLILSACWYFSPACRNNALVSPPLLVLARSESALPQYNACQLGLDEPRASTVSRDLNAAGVSPRRRQSETAPNQASPKAAFSLRSLLLSTGSRSVLSLVKSFVTPAIEIASVSGISATTVSRSEER